MNHNENSMNNASLFERSKTLVPGGVHSPVRSFKGLHRTPIFVTEGNGAYIKDVEGNEYIDFCMSFGPLILGHQNSIVKKEIISALDRGWSFGACEPYSLKLVDYITTRIPFVEMMRFVNSGTEAVMTALRLAKGITGRNLIVKFNGCFHGHVDSMLIKAGSGLAGTSEATSKGISPRVAEETLVLELNDRQGVSDLFKKYPGQIAAIIIEPLPANNGLLVQHQSFLQFLREITLEDGALLIFDEVISGFRVGFGGMAEKLGITPDLVTYGKIIGGGMPVGAIGGSKKFMEHLAPIGGVYQAGTLSANPLAMTAGYSTLQQLTSENYSLLESYTQKIISVFQTFFQQYNQGQFSEITMAQYGSLFWFVPGKDIHSLKDIPNSLSNKFYELFKVFLDRGIYLAPNAYEVSFVSLAHDEKVIEDLKQKLLF